MLQGDRPENFQDVPLKMMSSLSSAVVSPSSPFVSGYHSQQQEVIQRDVGVGQSSSVTKTEPFAFSNGTLYIPLVTKTHHGFYLCDASNGIGSGLSKVIRLIVNGKSFNMPIFKKRLFFYLVEPLENFWAFPISCSSRIFFFSLCNLVSLLILSPTYFLLIFFHLFTVYFVYVNYSTTRKPNKLS